MSTGLSDNIPEMRKVNPESSVFANFIAMGENFENVAKYLENLNENIIELIGTATINEIKQAVIDRIHQMKNKIEYLAVKNIGESEIQNGYRYTKLDDYTIRVEREGFPTWNTETLLIQVQETESKTVIYPVIVKERGYFDVKFSDPISTNGTILFL